MHRNYPGIRLHLGYYGPRVSAEPIAQMRPRLKEAAHEELSHDEASQREAEHRAAERSRRPASRVEIGVQVDRG